jgi:hypothetical protein
MSEATRPFSLASTPVDALQVFFKSVKTAVKNFSTAEDYLAHVRS